MLGFSLGLGTGLRKPPTASVADRQPAVASFGWPRRAAGRPWLASVRPWAAMAGYGRPEASQVTAYATPWVKGSGSVGTGGEYLNMTMYCWVSH